MRSLDRPMNPPSPIDDGRPAPRLPFEVTFNQLLVFLAVVGPMILMLCVAMPSVDLTYHLRAGASILGGHIPTVDTWTFTMPGREWVDADWLAQAMLAGVYQVAGWTGLALLRSLSMGALLGLIFLACRIRGADSKRAALLTAIAFVVLMPALALRPQTPAMVLMALTIVLVVGRHRWPRLLWLVPLVVVLWANVHGSVLLAPVVIGLAWLEDRQARIPARRLVMLGIAAIPAACISPFGIQTWVYALSLSTNGMVAAFVSEWQPASLRTLPGILFFASAIGVGAVLARRGRSTPWPVLLSLALFFLLGTYAIRGLVWWPIVAAVMVAGLVARPVVSPRITSRGANRFNALIVWLVIVLGVALLPVWRPVDGRIGTPTGVVSYAPAGVTAALRDLARPDDRLFNPRQWGSWFEFALPDLPIAVDSRIETFPTEVWSDYQTVETGIDGWSAILDRRGVTLVVAQTSEQPFIERLQSAGYRQLYADAEGVIFAAPTRVK